MYHFITKILTKMKYSISKWKLDYQSSPAELGERQRGQAWEQNQSKNGWCYLKSLNTTGSPWRPSHPFSNAQQGHLFKATKQALQDFVLSLLKWIPFTQYPLGFKSLGGMGCKAATRKVMCALTSGPWFLSSPWGYLYLIYDVLIFYKFKTAYRC